MNAILKQIIVVNIWCKIINKFQLLLRFIRNIDKAIIITLLTNNFKSSIFYHIWFNLCQLKGIFKWKVINDISWSSISWFQMMNAILKQIIALNILVSSYVTNFNYYWDPY